MIFVGVDPGGKGALGFIDESGDLIAVEDMPVDVIRIGATDRLRVSDVRLLDLLRGAPYGSMAFVEKPEGRPLAFRDKATGERKTRQPGAQGMLALGEAYGIVRCACTAQGYALTEMRPGEWKRAMGVSGDKDEARRRAAELFPRFVGAFARKKDDGRAEAALIARWGWLRNRRTTA